MERDKNTGKELNRNTRYKATVSFYVILIINCPNCDHTDFRMSFAKLPLRIFAYLSKETQYNLYQGAELVSALV